MYTRTHSNNIIKIFASLRAHCSIGLGDCVWIGCFLSRRFAPNSTHKRRPFFLTLRTAISEFVVCRPPSSPLSQPAPLDKSSVRAINSRTRCIAPHVLIHGHPRFPDRITQNAERKSRPSHSTRKTRTFRVSNHHKKGKTRCELHEDGIRTATTTSRLYLRKKILLLL